MGKSPHVVPHQAERIARVATVISSQGGPPERISWGSMTVLVVAAATFGSRARGRQLLALTPRAPWA
jgi:hypothetical protein